MARRRAKVVKRPASVRDIAEIADYLAATTSLAAADRFLASVEATAARLAGMPGLGARWDSPKPRLADVRSSAVARFRNHLIFYRPVEGGIEILRVLHGARNIASLLEDEEGG